MKWSSFCFKKQIETKKAPDFSEAFLVAGKVENSNQFLVDFYKIVDFVNS
jgi:hypothetical protein